MTIDRVPLAVRPPEVASLRLADGTRLDADIYRPRGEGPWPVLLLRQAYGRRVAATVTYAHPAWYAAQGYIVVVQDVRGRGTSEGVFDTLENEGPDGAETIAWCAALPGSDGQVGTYGFSYQGMNQLLAAAEAGPALKAVAPAMIGWSLVDDMVWEGGAFLLAGTLGWAAQVGADNARHRGDAAAYEAMRRAANALPLGDPVTADPAVMREHAGIHHYAKWTAAAPDDPLWQRLAPASRLEALLARALPMLFVGGWYDFTLPGTLAAWRAIAPHQPARTELHIGPWPHIPWGRRLAGVDFGPAAVSDVDCAQVAFFDRWLKGIAAPAPYDAPVRLFDTGARAWDVQGDWAETPCTLYLGGDGRVSVDPEAGTLAAQPGAAGSDCLVHDPWRPAPAIGGRWAAPAGPVDRAEVDQRGDVLTFTGAPLAKPLTVSGTVRAELVASADTPGFDLVCTLSRVGTDGSVRPIAEGARHVANHAGPTRLAVDLRSTHVTLAPGEALRLSVSAAAFPTYALNPGAGDPLHTPHRAAQVITITLHHGGEARSAIIFGTPAHKDPQP